MRINGVSSSGVTAPGIIDPVTAAIIRNRIEKAREDKKRKALILAKRKVKLYIINNDLTVSDDVLYKGRNDLVYGFEREELIKIKSLLKEIDSKTDIFFSAPLKKDTLDETIDALKFIIQTGSYPEDYSSFFDISNGMMIDLHI